MKKIKLSDAEWKIMDKLWETPHLTIRQLTESLFEDTGWEKHTVITLLGRIEKKGALSYRQNGRAKEFYPLVSREDACGEETRSFLEKVYQGSLSMMVHSMVERESLSEQERQELIRILEKGEKKGG